MWVQPGMQRPAPTHLGVQLHCALVEAASLFEVLPQEGVLRLLQYISRGLLWGSKAARMGMEEAGSGWQARQAAGGRAAGALGECIRASQAGVGCHPLIGRYLILVWRRRHRLVALLGRNHDAAATDGEPPTSPALWIKGLNREGIANRPSGCWFPLQSALSPGT